MTDAKKKKKNLPNASFALQPAWGEGASGAGAAATGGSPRASRGSEEGHSCWDLGQGTRVQAGTEGATVGVEGGCGDRVGERREGDRHVPVGSEGSSSHVPWRVRFVPLELWLTLLPLGAAGILAAAERPLDGCAGMRRGSCWQPQHSTAQAQTSGFGISLTRWEFDSTSWPADAAATVKCTCSPAMHCDQSHLCSAPPTKPANRACACMRHQPPLSRLAVEVQPVKILLL